jgi:hypothetical protein
MGEIYSNEIREADLSFVAKYEAKSMDAPDPSGKSRTIQRAARNRIRMANFACWLVAPGPLAFRCAVHERQVGDQGFPIRWLRDLSGFADVKDAFAGALGPTCAQARSSRL